jgi:hypothetical protein
MERMRTVDTASSLWKLTHEIDDNIEPILLVDDKDLSGFLKAIRENGIEL